MQVNQLYGTRLQYRQDKINDSQQELPSGEPNQNRE